MSNQRNNHKAWMKAQREHLAATGHRLRDAVSTGWEGAGRGLRALARAGGGFLTASWDGRYKPADNQSQLGPKVSHNLRPATTAVAAVAEGRVPQHISPNPIAFMRPNRFSVSAIPAPLQQTPLLDLAASEHARTSAVSARFSDPQKPVLAEYEHAAEVHSDQQKELQLEDLFAKKCDEFSRRLEDRLDTFCEQTSMRLDALSREAIQHFTEALNQQATEALSSLMADWAEQNRLLMDTECHKALDRFDGRLEKLSSARLEIHRKEIQNLSAHLKSRLRGVAHALQDLGPASYRS